MGPGGDGHRAVVLVDDLGLVLHSGRGRQRFAEVGELLGRSPAGAGEIVGGESGFKGGQIRGLEPERGMSLLRGQDGRGRDDEAGVGLIEIGGSLVAGQGGERYEQARSQESAAKVTSLATDHVARVCL